MKKLFILIALIILVVIFFPKTSFKTSSGIWDVEYTTKKECKCIGVEYDITKNVMDAGSNILCFGVVYDCNCFRKKVITPSDLENKSMEELKTLRDTWETVVCK